MFSQAMKRGLIIFIFLLAIALIWVLIGDEECPPGQHHEENCHLENRQVWRFGHRTIRTIDVCDDVCRSDAP